MLHMFLNNPIQEIDTCTHLLIKLYDKVSAFPVQIPNTS